MYIIHALWYLDNVCFLAVAFEFGEWDWEAAFVNLYFAATMNDSMAQMALGYRFMHGLGVQQNCSTALLYYKEVADVVVRVTETSAAFPKARS